MTLTACSNNQELANKFAPDPKLKENQIVLGQQQSSASNSSQSQQSSNNSSVTANNNQLPPDFPQSIPIYPQAKLAHNQVEYQGKQQTLWTSPDEIKSITTFYREQLVTANWKIINPNQQLDANSQLIASKDNLEITISFAPVQHDIIRIFAKIPPNFAQENAFIISYHQDQSQPSQSSSSSVTSSNQSATNPTDNATIPQQLQEYINDLNSLNILIPKPETTAQLNQVITRREYVRWLVAANNRIYENNPGKQIRLASDNDKPVFTDIKNNDPDFAVIQGLAIAGLIPSALNNDTTALKFRPDAPLTREDLISWKVPLDFRKALPQASIDAVKETWGFQDTATIAPLALRSLYIDFQNGDKANVSRVFGYTILFQPKKTVTRAEAAAALWYFGYQGDGISAKDALSSQQ